MYLDYDADSGITSVNDDAIIECDGPPRPDTNNHKLKHFLFFLLLTLYLTRMSCQA